jgi:hypothetical protein
MNTIRKCRPVIYFENNELYSRVIYEEVCSKFSNYTKESKFNLTEFCMNELGYSKCIHKFNNSIDTLLIP